MDSQFLDDVCSNICEHLCDRTATLFLGAGVNYGIRNQSGQMIPMGSDLADMICRDLIQDKDLKLGLEEASDMAIYKLGTQSVNKYIFSILECFNPGPAHFSLVQMPWDVIYTTNFDRLIEKAFSSKAIKAAGYVRPVCSVETDLTQFTDQDIIYYKLHGSIDIANTPQGRLILTKADFRDYEKLRKPLFKRLERDFVSRTMVFVGYSFSDDNFRSIIDDCREQIGAKMFPLSYAVRPGHRPSEATFWKEKYNIQLLDIDGTEFSEALKQYWIGSKRTVLSFAEISSGDFARVDEMSRMPRIGDSFYQVTPSRCTGSPNPQLFFRGGAASWADIRDKIPHNRDEYWSLIHGIYEDLIDPGSPVSIFLVTGHAGTGKTTLIRSAIYDIVKDYSEPVYTLIHINETPLDARIIAPLIKDGDNKLLHR